MKATIVLNEIRRTPLASQAGPETAEPSTETGSIIDAAISRQMAEIERTFTDRWEW